jgi:leader peptidase (prepilin peptidase)/N-methyltransferase
MMLRWTPRGVRVPVPVCTALVAVLWVVVVQRAGVGLPLWWWPVPLVLGWAGVLLGGADLVARRLPDVLTLPAYPVVAVMLTLAAIGTANGGLVLDPPVGRPVPG